MEYGIEDLVNFTVVFKFRAITLNEKQISQIPQIELESKERHIKRNISFK